ncbi:XkdF-like putative serine protease domain-containing protein [Dysgonomonas macrotermitis]|uniref:Putative phage serine protease XkdF n=1 Tax=Dysgonomonas macrotermitis TaxID=1346286 RepID=A0A1M5HDF7_9BACT|nr:XkdF-like putative serine protease domain-containing protein [Dysgonomonas macrotermitis]SHG13852.1 Putative phage serine protease XkdF [Dysgonomonas macrotermitis]
MDIPIYNCLINESLEDESGIYAISFVESPANESDFVTLAKQKAGVFLNKDTQKQVLTGVVLCPDQLIYRNDPEHGAYYIRFSADQIEKIALKMMRTGIALHNTTHQHQSPLEGNYLTELWIVEDTGNDKSRALGFDTLPKGTLMCSYKVEDKYYWDTQVMTGNVKGFSLEGFFIQQADLITNTNQNKHEKMNRKAKKSGTLLSRIAQFFLDIQTVEKADSTSSGSICIIFTLADGKEIYVDKDGFATLDGEQVPAGEHPLSDGNILVIDGEGQLVETKEASVSNVDPEKVTAPQTLKKTGAESVDILKAKIADLEAKLAELAGLAEEANTEVQKLRQHSPSVSPLTANSSQRKFTEMRRYEQMAQALSLSIKHKIKK